MFKNYMRTPLLIEKDANINYHGIVLGIYADNHYNFVLDIRTINDMMLSDNNKW